GNTTRPSISAPAPPSASAAAPTRPENTTVPATVAPAPPSTQPTPTTEPSTSASVATTTTANTPAVVVVPGANGTSQTSGPSTPPTGLASGSNATSSSNTRWGWIVAALFGIAAVGAFVVAGVRRRRVARAAEQWSFLARPVYDEACQTADLLRTDRSMDAQVDRVATELDRASSQAPDDTRRNVTAGAAAAL